MPSTSPVPHSKRHFLSFVCACFCFIISLILTVVGYLNNEWIIVEKENGHKFMRGLNDDCYTLGEGNKCKEWSLHNATIPGYEGWPAPFDKLNAPSAASYLLMWLARLVVLIPLTWSILTITICCSEPMEQKVRKIQSIFKIGIVLLSAWLLLFLIWLLAVYAGHPPLEGITSSDISMGWGSKLYYWGGVIPYFLGFSFLFYEEIRAFINSRRSHRPLSTNTDTELVSRT